MFVLRTETTLTLCESASFHFTLKRKGLIFFRKLHSKLFSTFQCFTAKNLSRSWKQDSQVWSVRAPICQATPCSCWHADIPLSDPNPTGFELWKAWVSHHMTITLWSPDRPINSSSFVSVLGFKCLDVFWSLQALTGCFSLESPTLWLYRYWCPLVDDQNLSSHWHLLSWLLQV